MRSCAIAVAMDAASRLFSSSPASGAATTSGVPHTADASTGVPQAMASRSTLAQPSRDDARIRASAQL